MAWEFVFLDTVVRQSDDSFEGGEAPHEGALRIITKAQRRSFLRRPSAVARSHFYLYTIEFFLIYMTK